MKITSLFILALLLINAPLNTYAKNTSLKYDKENPVCSSQYETFNYVAYYYEGEKKMNTRASAFYSLSLLQREKYNFSDAIKLAHYAIYHYNKAGNLKGIQQSYNTIGNSFIDLGANQKAKKYYGRSLQIAEFLNDDIAIAMAYNNLAGIYYKLGDLEQSQNYFERSIPLFERTEVPKLVTSTKLNYSVVIMESDPELALKLLMEVDSLFGHGERIAQDDVSIYGNIGACYYRQGKIDEAIKKYKQSIHISDKNELTYASMVNYKDIAEIYESIGDYKNALLNYNTYDSLKNLIVSDREREKATQLAFNYHIKLKNQKSQTLALKFEKSSLEKKELTYLFWLVASLLLAAALLTVAIFINFKARNNRLRHKREVLLINNKIISNNLNQSMLNSENLQKELDTSKEDLVNFSIDIQRKNAIQEKIHIGIKKLKRFALSDREMLIELRELIHLSNTNLKLNSDNEALASNIDKVNHEFFKHLTALFPSLTMNEKKLCGLIRIKTSIQEVASIRGISPKSVEMSRYRLKKKMQLDEHQNLDQFIEQI